MESAYSWNCVGRRSQLHSDDDCEECVVEMHIPPIKGTAQVTLKVVTGTEPTLSMPMLLASGHDAEHGSRGNRAVNERRRRLVPEGLDKQTHMIEQALSSICVLCLCKTRTVHTVILTTCRLCSFKLKSTLDAGLIDGWMESKDGLQTVFSHSTGSLER